MLVESQESRGLEPRRGGMLVENQERRGLEPRRGGTCSAECRPYGALIPLPPWLTTNMPPLRGLTRHTP
jgi:hypothetical protein